MASNQYGCSPSFIRVPIAKPDPRRSKIKKRGESLQPRRFRVPLRLRKGTAFGLVLGRGAISADYRLKMAVLWLTR